MNTLPLPPPTLRRRSSDLLYTRRGLLLLALLAALLLWFGVISLGSLFALLSELTTELPVHILLDSSACMDWGSDPHGPTKFAAARRRSAALA